MKYPHKIAVGQIPIPSGMIQTVIETDHGKHTTRNQFFATPEEFLTFWKPLVDYYEKVKNEQNT